MSNQDAHDYRIVVGFDGSKGAIKALEWAADEARRREASLAVVRAWTPGEYGTYEEMEQLVRDALPGEVSAILPADPARSVELVVRKGTPAKVLLHEARDADMLVVGSRGHGGFTGLLLGSVSQQLVTHAGAPVVVIVRD